MDWTKYPNFTEEEFKCKHCGKAEMNAAFMGKLQHLRNAYGKPMTITSGYRTAKRWRALYPSGHLAQPATP